MRLFYKLKIFIWCTEMFLVLHISSHQKFGDLLIMFIKPILIFPFPGTKDYNSDHVDFCLKLILCSIKFHFLNDFWRFSHTFESQSFDSSMFRDLYFKRSRFIKIYHFNLSCTGWWSMSHFAFHMTQTVNTL